MSQTCSWYQIYMSWSLVCSWVLEFIFRCSLFSCFASLVLIFLNLFLGLLSLWFLLLLLFVSMEFYYSPLAFPLFHPPVSFPFFVKYIHVPAFSRFCYGCCLFPVLLSVYRLLCLAFNFSSSTHLLYSCFSSTTHTLVCFLFYLTFLVLCWSVPASAFLQLPLELHKIWAIKVLWSSLWQQLWATYSAIQSRGTFPSSSNSPLTPWLMLL